MKPWSTFIRYSCRQSLRAPVRLMSILLTVTLVCAFLCVSLDLRRNAQANLHLLQQQFHVVAVPTFRGGVDSEGNLTETAGIDYVGYVEVPAKNFDLSQLTDAIGVQDVFVHRQYGAYIHTEKELAQTHPSKADYEDVFIFTYTGTTPKTISWTTGTDGATGANITLDWSATGMEQYPLGSRHQGFRIQNTISHSLIQSVWSELLPDLGLDSMWAKTDDGVRTGDLILQPGQQYIASGKWIIAHSGSEISLAAMYLDVDQGHNKRTVTYMDGAWYTVGDPGEYHVSYPCIVPYTEDFWNTSVGAYYQDAIEICQVNKKALTAVTTNDLSLYAPFYSGGVYVSQGRNFTAEDYAGAKVCLVSQHLAELNGWKIGDTLDLSLFEAVYSQNGQASDVQSYYQPLEEVYHAETDTYSLMQKDGFFHQAVYEIVGFYDGKVTKSGFLNDMQYTQDEGLDRRVVIIPEASVTSLPDVPLTQYNTTVLLEDAQVMAFMSHMEASGLLEQRKGAYQIELAVYDQELSGMKQGLRQLDTVSRLTLYLSCAAAVTTVIFMTVLIVLPSRKEIATLRALGVRRVQVPLAVLSGLLLICLMAACLGGFLGHLASRQVTSFILETAQTDLGDLSFSTVQSGTDDLFSILTVQTGIGNIMLAACTVWGLLCVLTVGLTLAEAARPPMHRLGMKE